MVGRRIKYKVIAHGPRGVTMHPLRALWEWYHIVHWKSLVKNQDVNTRYLGSHPPFWMVSRWQPREKKKCLYNVISASYHLLSLLLCGQALFKIHNSIYDIYS